MVGHKLVRAGVALGVAALLVVGFDFVTYATTGSSLLLGKVNRAGDTTTLVNNHNGAALKLIARRGQPALAVSNRAKVAMLNADTVDGMHARRLASNVTTFLAGRSKHTYNGVIAWQTPMPAGVYQVTVRAGIVAAQASPSSPVAVVCGIVDLNSGGGDHVHVYVADTSSFDGNIPGFVSGAETIHIKASANPGLLCAAEGSFSFYTLPHASFTTISQRSSQQATQVPVGANAAQRAFGIR
jgi:hypothetical protein